MLKRSLYAVVVVFFAALIVLALSPSAALADGETPAPSPSPSSTYNVGPEPTVSVRPTLSTVPLDPFTTPAPSLPSSEEVSARHMAETLAEIETLENALTVDYVAELAASAYPVYAEETPVPAKPAAAVAVKPATPGLPSTGV